MVVGRAQTVHVPLPVSLVATVEVYRVMALLHVQERFQGHSTVIQLRTQVEVRKLLAVLAVGLQVAVAGIQPEVRAHLASEGTARR